MGCVSSKPTVDAGNSANQQTDNSATIATPGNPTENQASVSATSPNAPISNNAPGNSIKYQASNPANSSDPARPLIKAKVDISQGGRHFTRFESTIKDRCDLFAPLEAACEILKFMLDATRVRLC
jgi:hypothetical protein